MGKYNIPIIALAVFSITILLNSFNDNANAEITNVIMNTTTAVDDGGTSLSSVAGVDNLMAGEHANAGSTLIGKSFNAIRIPVMCVDTSTPSTKCNNDKYAQSKVTIGVWNTASSPPTLANAKKIFGSLAVTSLNNRFNVGMTSEDFKTFFSTTSYTVATNDVIGLFYNFDTGDTAVLVSFRANTANPFDGTNSRFNFYDEATFWTLPGGSNAQDGIMLLYTETQIPSSGTGGLDCSLPANQNILTCRLLATEGVFSAPSETILEGANTIFIQIGFLDGSDTNPQTNGTGYILTAIALGIFVGILWVASRGQLTEIPTFIWFIGTIAIVGALTIADFIDPTFLVITVIAIVGFAVAKVRNVFGGSGLFQGES